MIVVLISILVPISLAFGVPHILHHYGAKIEKRSRWLLYAACALFLISWHVPSPLIKGEDTHFMTHFIGGGLFSGVLWLYIRQSFGWRPSWFVEAVVIFTLVSTLGCVNELAEIVMKELSLVNLTLTDTSWDILANTLGAVLMWVTARIFALFRSTVL